MTHAVCCHACEETVWPPADAEGPGGQSEIAACRLALEHVRESGHTQVYTIAGCYYVGDGERPTAFGDGATDPEDVAVPQRSKLANVTAGAARRLRDAADDVEGDYEDYPGIVARHLRNYADAVESNVTASAQTPETSRVRPPETESERESG